MLDIARPWMMVVRTRRAVNRKIGVMQNVLDAESVEARTIWLRIEEIVRLLSLC